MDRSLNDDELPDVSRTDDWLLDQGLSRAWERDDSYRQDGRYHEIFEQHEIEAVCEKCRFDAYRLSLCRAKIAVLFADLKRMRFLRAHDGDEAGIYLDRALVHIPYQLSVLRSRLRVRAAQLLECERLACGLEGADYLNRAGELLLEALMPEEVAPDEDIDGDLLAELETFAAEPDVEPFYSGNDGKDARRKICEPCREHYDSLIIARIGLEKYEEAPGGIDQFDSREVDLRRIALKRAQLRLELCEQFLCNPDAPRRLVREVQREPSGFDVELAELRPSTNCRPCDAISDEIGAERIWLRHDVRYASKCERWAARAEDTDTAEMYRVRGRVQMDSAAQHEVRIEVLRELLIECEQLNCPPAAARPAAGSELEAALADPTVEASLDDEEGDVDAPPTLVPPADLVASWHAGKKVEKQWRTAAKGLGWRGPIRRWRRQTLLPTHPEHHRAQSSIDESLRAFLGQQFEGATRLSTTSSSMSEDSTRTAVVYPIDHRGDLIDRRQPAFMRAHQQLAAIVIVTLVRVPATDGRDAWGASIKVFITKNDRLLDAKTHWQLGDPSDWFASPYQALYRCLTGITDDDRVLRRVDRLQGKPRKPDVWADSTGPSSTSETDDDAEAIAEEFDKQFADEAALDEDPGPPTTHYGELPKRSKRKRMLAAGAVAAVAVFGGFAFSYLRDEEPRDAVDQQSIDAVSEAMRSGEEDEEEPPESQDLDTPQPVDDGAVDPVPDDTAEFNDVPLIGPLPDGVTIGVDETGQAIFSSSAAPALVIFGMDIETFVARIVDGNPTNAAQGFENTSFPCGGIGVSYSVHCAVGAGQVPVGEWLVVAVDLDAVAPDRGVAYEYGLAIDPDGDESNNYNFFPPFDWDFFRNTEQWWRLSFDAEGDAFVWADGYVDAVPGVPRHTAAAVIVYEDKLVWVIPTSELTGTNVMIRLTAFANSDPTNELPSASTSAGDVNGENPTSPLTPVPTLVHEITISPENWPDIEGTQPRLPFEGVAATPAWREALVGDVATRVNEALGSGTIDALLGTVHPEVRRAFGDDACRAALAASLGQAGSVEAAGQPEIVADFAPGSLLANFRIRYSTGDVDSPLVIAPASDGRFYFVFPCESS